MGNRSVQTRRVRHHFGTGAQEYSQLAVVQPRVVGGLIERLQQIPVPSKGAVLDIGTGTGQLVHAYLANQCHCGPVVGFDIALPMCQQAVRSLPQLQAVVGDAHSLPFAHDQFSLVLSASVFQWMNDLPAVFAEVERVLLPGGWFVFALFGEKTLFELKDAYRQAWSLCDKPGGGHVQDFPSIERVEDALRLSPGFSQFTIEQAFEREHHPDVQTLLKRLKGIGAHNASSVQPKGLASRQVMTTMMRLYQQAHGNEQGVPATYEVIYGWVQKRTD